MREISSLWGLIVVLVLLCERELLYVIVSMFVRERVHHNTSNKRGSHDSYDSDIETRQFWGKNWISPLAGDATRNEC